MKELFKDTIVKNRRRSHWKEFMIHQVHQSKLSGIIDQNLLIIYGLKGNKLLKKEEEALSWKEFKFILNQINSSTFFHIYIT